jgi:hypothetical protein
LAVYSDRDPVSYYVTDLAKRSLDLIGAQRPWIDATRMHAVSIMSYKNGDGAALDAYLTLPAGADRENPAPLVVIPQYGARHTWDFDEVTQFFASRGYAVLCPNHRGSPGYDWMLSHERELDFKAMQRDISSATRAMIKTGMIDPNGSPSSGMGQALTWPCSVSCRPRSFIAAPPPSRESLTGRTSRAPDKAAAFQIRICNASSAASTSP